MLIINYFPPTTAQKKLFLLNKQLEQSELPSKKAKKEISSNISHLRTKKNKKILKIQDT